MAVVVALLLTVLLLFAALAIDLGLLRADRAQSQSAADMAAAAAAQVHEPNVAGSARTACEEAIAYASVNLGIALTASGGGCDVFPVGAACDPAVAISATYVGTANDGGAYTVTVASPVPDDDILMGDQPAATSDGQTCERVGVSIERGRAYLLARVAGFTEGATRAGAVGVATDIGTGGIASLIVLQPSGCETIKTIGRHLIRVDDATFDGETFPGIIAVDTEQCPGSGNIFAPANNIHTNIQATRIISYGLQQGAPRVLPTNLQALASIVPPPVPDNYVSRLSIDHRFNCKASYPTGPVWSPASYAQLQTFSDGSSTLDCDESADGVSTGPHLEVLHDRYASFTAADAASAGWGVYPDDIPGAGCSGQGPTNASYRLGPGGNVAGVGLRSRWFINCDTLRPTDMRFLDVDTIVSRGTINLQSSNSRMTVTGTAAEGAILFLQDGASLTRNGSGAEFDFQNLFVYVVNGVVTIQSGNQGRLNWEAMPTSAVEGCAYVDGVPNASCFAPLALWSNGSGTHSIGGSADLNMRGTYFIPNAELALNGTTDFDLRAAQMFVNRISGNGNATTILAPDPRFNVPDVADPFRALIR